MGGAVAFLIDYGGGGAGYGDGVQGAVGVGETGTASIGGLNAGFHNADVYPNFVHVGHGGDLGENGSLANVGDPATTSITVSTGSSGLAGKAIIGYNNFTAAPGSTIIVKGAKVP